MHFVVVFMYSALTQSFSLVQIMEPDSAHEKCIISSSSRITGVLGFVQIIEGFIH